MGSNWSKDFKTGFFVGLGVGAALLVLGIVSGAVRR